MYVSPNFKTKKAFREAVEAGHPVSLYEPGLSFGVPANGNVAVEGPHYPQPHTWYATVTLSAGKVVKVR